MGFFDVPSEKTASPAVAAWMKRYRERFNLEPTIQAALGFTMMDIVAQALQKAEASRFAERPVRTLSAGQRRRAALAMLCLQRLPLWVLDEPVTHLDAAGQSLVARLVAEQVGEGGIVIAATHQDLGLSSEVRQELQLGRKAA